MASYDDLAQRAGPAPDIHIRTTRVGRAVVCTPAGNLHSENEEEVRRALEAALGGRPAVLVVDLSEVRMFTSSGLNVLLGTRRTAHACGILLVLAAPSARVRRTLAITGVGGLFPVCPSLRLALQHRSPEVLRDEA